MMLDAMVNSPKSPETLSQIQVMSSDELREMFETLQRATSLTPDELTFSRVLAYRLAELDPEHETPTYQTALQFFHQGVTLGIHPGELSRDEFVNGKYLHEMDKSNKILVIYPFYYSNYYELFTELQKNFTSKFKLDFTLNDEARELDIDESAYVKFSGHLTLVGRFYDSIIHASNTELANIDHALSDNNHQKNLIHAMKGLVGREINPSMRMSQESCLNEIDTIFDSCLQSDACVNYLKSRPLIIKDGYTRPRRKNIRTISTRLEKPEGMSLDDMITHISDCDNLDKPKDAQRIAKAYANGAGNPLNIKTLFKFLYQINDSEKCGKFIAALFDNSLTFESIVNDDLEDIIYALNFCTRFFKFMRSHTQLINEKLARYVGNMNLHEKSLSQLRDMLKLSQLRVFKETGHVPQFNEKLVGHLLRVDLDVNTIKELATFMDLLYALRGDEDFPARTDLWSIFRTHVKTAEDFNELLSSIEPDTGLQCELFNNEMSYIRSLVKTLKDLSSILVNISSKYLDPNYFFNFIDDEEEEGVDDSPALIYVEEVIYLRSSLLKLIGSDLLNLILSAQDFLDLMSAAQSNVFPENFYQRGSLSKTVNELSVIFSNDIFDSLDSLKSLLESEHCFHYLDVIINYLPEKKILDLIPNFETLKIVNGFNVEWRLRNQLLTKAFSGDPMKYVGVQNDVSVDAFKYCLSFMTMESYSKIVQKSGKTVEQLIETKEDFIYFIGRSNTPIDMKEYKGLVRRYILSRKDLDDMSRQLGALSNVGRDIIVQDLEHFIPMIEDYESFSALDSQITHFEGGVEYYPESCKIKFFLAVAPMLPKLITDFERLYQLIRPTRMRTWNHDINPIFAPTVTSILLRVLSEKIPGMIRTHHDLIKFFTACPKSSEFEEVLSHFTPVQLSRYITSKCELDAVVKSFFWSIEYFNSFILNAIYRRTHLFIKTESDFLSIYDLLDESNEPQLMKIMLNSMSKLPIVMKMASTENRGKYSESMSIFLMKLVEEYEKRTLFDKLKEAVKHLDELVVPSDLLSPATDPMTWLMSLELGAPSDPLSKFIRDSDEYKQLTSSIGDKVDVIQVIRILEDETDDKTKVDLLIRVGVELKKVVDMPSSSAHSQSTFFISYQGSGSQPVTSDLNPTHEKKSAHGHSSQNNGESNKRFKQNND